MLLKKVVAAAAVVQCALNNFYFIDAVHRKKYNTKSKRNWFFSIFNSGVMVGNG